MTPNPNASLGKDKLKANESVLTREEFNRIVFMLSLKLPEEINEVVRQKLLGYVDSLESRPLPTPARDIEGIVNEEPELPGEMPDEMWEAIKGDRDATANAMRIAVKQTKENILRRYRERSPQ